MLYIHTSHTFLYILYIILYIVYLLHFTHTMKRKYVPYRRFDQMLWFFALAEEEHRSKHWQGSNPVFKAGIGELPLSHDQAAS